MNSMHIAIPTLLKVGEGTLDHIGDYLKLQRIESVNLFFGNDLIALLGERVKTSLEKNSIQILGM